MQYLSLAALTTLIASAAAVGKAVVKNNSGDTIYVWSVGAEISEKATVESGKSWSEKLHSDPTTGGIAIKITTKDDGIFTGAPQQIFAYNLVDDAVWYDLSTVDGNPFEGQHITVTNRRNPTIDWPQGTNPGGEFSQIKAGDKDRNVVFLVGAGESSSTEQPSEEQPSTEQPSSTTEEQPATTEQPAAEQSSTEEQTTEEQTTEEQPTEEQPTEEQSTEEQSTEGQSS